MLKANEQQHKNFDPKSNFTAAPQAVVVDEQGLKYRKLGATDHMTGCASLFSTYTPGSGHIKVKIAYGSLATVAGAGTIILGPHITFFNVLHVPKLSCNLLSKEEHWQC